MVTCDKCRGKGYIRNIYDKYYKDVMYYTCGFCGGKGKLDWLEYILPDENRHAIFTYFSEDECREDCIRQLFINGFLYKVERDVWEK